MPPDHHGLHASDKVFYQVNRKLAGIVMVNQRPVP